jgi:hypothetical protein
VDKVNPLQWVAHIAGLDNAAGFWYCLWSGIVGDAALFGAGWAILRKHNCEVHGCPRLGRHHWKDPTTGQDHHLCRTHHPLGHLTAQGVCEAESSKLDLQTQPEEH